MNKAFGTQFGKVRGVIASDAGDEIVLNHWTCNVLTAKDFDEQLKMRFLFWKQHQEESENGGEVDEELWKVMDNYVWSPPLEAPLGSRRILVDKNYGKTMAWIKVDGTDDRITYYKQEDKLSITSHPCNIPF